MKNIKIYQLRNIEKYGFRSFNFARKNGFDMRDYRLVYECNRADDYGLESAYNEFNLRKPIDFKGHSLSVSDLVEINGAIWYCDDICWQRI